jgi:hypothetical protein
LLGDLAECQRLCKELRTRIPQSASN